MTREAAITAMLTTLAVDWWRYIGCETCNARRQEPCQTVDGPARGPHKSRRRVALAMHGTLWLLDRGHVGDVLGAAPDQAAPAAEDTSAAAGAAGSEA